MSHTEDEYTRALDEFITLCIDVKNACTQLDSIDFSTLDNLIVGASKHIHNLADKAPDSQHTLRDLNNNLAEMHTELKLMKYYSYSQQSQEAITERALCLIEEGLDVLAKVT